MACGMRSIKLTLLGASLLCGGCTEMTFGSGIGQAPVEEIDRPDPPPMSISAVFAADPDPATHFVILTLDAGADPMDLEGMQLCNADDTCVALTGTLSDPLKVDASTLDLVATAGALAVVDAAGAPQAHFAWGADPSLLGAPYYAAAVRAGATDTKQFVPVPFPLLDRAAVTPLGCADPSPAEAASPDLNLTVDATLCLVDPASPLSLTVSSGSPRRAEITNVSGVDLLLYGVRVCRPPNCTTLGREEILPAGGSTTFHFGPQAPSGGTAIEHLPRLEPLESGGVLQVYAPGISTDAPLLEATL